ncbi:MAG: maltokinase N-terminal cap-like domain-containing protein [Microthrixaceae bacterium]
MISMSDLLPLIGDHLRAHLERQRWSGAHGRHVTSVEPRWQEVVRAEAPMLVWTVARVRFDDGDEQDYQLFLGIRPADPMPEFLQGKERELVAVLPDATPPVVVYDALVDPDLAIEVLHLVAPDLEVSVRRPIVLEHSNSSIVFDEAHILKIFRRVEPGVNPDAEITRVLSGRGVDHVLAPIAELRRDGLDLALLREYLVGATDGWEIARASVRDLLAGGLAPEESGADFAPDAARLGKLLASLHLEMAHAWGAAPGDNARWAREMEANLERVRADASDLPGAFDVTAIGDLFRSVSRVDDAGSEIRIHGDLHLAQLIKSDDGWKVLDFEGEPARRRAERFTTSSPLRDVAGLVRSLHYASVTGLIEWADDDPVLADLVVEWERRNREALCGAYFGADGIDELLPSSTEARVTLLTAFELDKAVYEVGYELGHRPDLVGIPLDAIARLVGARAGA